MDTFATGLTLSTTLLYWNLLSSRMHHTHMCIVKSVLVSGMSHFSIIMHSDICDLFTPHICGLSSEFATDIAGIIFVAFEINDLLCHRNSLSREMIYHHICHICLAIYMRYKANLTVVCTILLLQDTSSIFLNLYTAIRNDYVVAKHVCMCVFAALFFIYRVLVSSIAYASCLYMRMSDPTLTVMWTAAHGLQLYWFKKIVRKICQVVKPSLKISRKASQE